MRAGGRTAAILASRTSTCRRMTWTPNLVDDLPAAQMNELSPWLPDQWKQLQPARMANLQ